jgi:methylmalonyl-CoA decarboxylase
VSAASGRTMITWRVEDKVGTLALDNPPKRNALGAQTVEEILVALGEFECAGVRAVVLRTAEPVDVWSAGHDIGELPVHGLDPLPFADPLEGLLRAVREFPGAVIAMVHGTVWGGACDLVLNCDMVVGDETAAFAVTPARLGLPYSASGIQYFLARLPLQVVNELFMTADLLPADRAHAVGILNLLVPEDELEACAYDLAQRVRRRSGQAIRAYKLQATTFARAVALSAQDSQWINQLRHDVYSGDDYAEGIAAFREKRPPDFG